jgi:putative ubiquitin-RnfH superfamily antitoxin RatB of RatAB toxin-antitoxin module
MVTIELVYVAPDQSVLHFNISLPDGAVVRDALNESGIYKSHPETQELPIGIYAKLVSLETLLKNGDRVELYRLLALDPKEKRRRLARLKK